MRSGLGSSALSSVRRRKSTALLGIARLKQRHPAPFPPIRPRAAPWHPDSAEKNLHRSAPEVRCDRRPCLRKQITTQTSYSDKLISPDTARNTTKKTSFRDLFVTFLSQTLPDRNFVVVFYHRSRAVPATSPNLQRSTTMKALSLILITALCFASVGCSSNGTSTKLKNKLQPDTHILFEGAY
jgi:hypothetical protein